MPPVSTTVADRLPVVQDRSSGGNTLTRFGFALGLIVLMPAFVNVLAFDPVVMAFHNSKILQLANVLCCVYGIAMILTSREATNNVLRCRAPFVLIGLAFLSMLWSYDPYSTLRASYVLLTTTVFALAMAARLSYPTCVRLIVRTMSFVCVLSVIWVIFFPLYGVHPNIFLHAGLWRGVFTHKQGLGVVSGLTTGLLLFYGSLAFSSAIVRFGALGSAIACLVGTQSATGLLIAIVLTVTFYITYHIARLPVPQRKAMLSALFGLIAVFYMAFHFQLLDFVMPLLGKDADLTGRTGFWPWVMNNIRYSNPLLGGGFSSGWEEIIAPDQSIDNGYIELLGSFGYLGATIVLTIYARTIWIGSKLLLSQSQDAAIRIFPFNIMLIEFFINITEANFMTKSINSILVVVSIYYAARLRTEFNLHSADRVTLATKHPAFLQNAHGRSHR